MNTVFCRRTLAHFTTLAEPRSAGIAFATHGMDRLIRASFKTGQGIYGVPRVFLDLREAHETCSKHRVARLMTENGLRALHGYRTAAGTLASRRC